MNDGNGFDELIRDRSLNVARRDGARAFKAVKKKVAGRLIDYRPLFAAHPRQSVCVEGMGRGCEAVTRWCESGDHRMPRWDVDGSRGPPRRDRMPLRRFRSNAA